MQPVLSAGCRQHVVRSVLPASCRKDQLPLQTQPVVWAGCRQHVGGRWRKEADSVPLPVKPVCRVPAAATVLGGCGRLGRFW